MSDWGFCTKSIAGGAVVLFKTKPAVPMKAELTKKYKSIVLGVFCQIETPEQSVLVAEVAEHQMVHVDQSSNTKKGLATSFLHFSESKYNSDPA